MDETGLNTIDVTSPAVVLSAGRNFAAALSETMQFKAFERSLMRRLSRRCHRPGGHLLTGNRAQFATCILKLNAATEARRHRTGAFEGKITPLLRQRASLCVCPSRTGRTLPTSSGRYCR